jgi:hypothetical protein
VPLPHFFWESMPPNDYIQGIASKNDGLENHNFHKYIEPNWWLFDAREAIWIATLKVFPG